MQIGANTRASPSHAAEGRVRRYNTGRVASVDLHARLHTLTPVVVRLCRRLELPVPALMYDECDEINAGVTGTGPHDAVLYFSGGALRKLSDREAVAVAAHELAHIAAGDFDVRDADAFVFGRRARPSLGSWLSDLIGLTSGARLKRRREYAADRLAAALTGEEALIAALRKTAQDRCHVGSRWLATHPNPRRRIRALRKLGRERSRARQPRGNQLLLRVFYRGV